MEIKASSDTSKKEFSNPLKIEYNNVICKDGFCVIPNQDKNSSFENQGEKNLFDPI